MLPDVQVPPEIIDHHARATGLLRSIAHLLGGLPPVKARRLARWLENDEWISAGARSKADFRRSKIRRVK